MDLYSEKPIRPPTAAAITKTPESTMRKISRIMAIDSISNLWFYFYIMLIY